MEKITYGFYASSLGEMVLGKTETGLCWLGFMVKGYKGDGLERMKAHFQGSVFDRDDDAVKVLGDKIIDAWRDGREKDIALDLHGTDFQKSVWNALLDVSRGVVCSYGDIAHEIGKPGAARAVGSAVGENPVSLIVPCHRILKSDGGVGNYGWGADLKREILRAEGIRDLAA